MNKDGSIWKHGTLYLLNKLEQFKLPNSKTLAAIAYDLYQFKEFLSKNKEINNLKAPKRKVLRPTYGYRSHLQDLIETNKIARSTAARRMSSIINFYHWLKKQHDIKFEHLLWDESDRFIYYQNNIGAQRSKAVKATNLHIPVPDTSEDFSEFLNDGGKLRPLNRNEQIWLIQALKESKNVEMTLSFIVALATGARMQTIYTLRLQQFITLSISNEKYIPIAVGLGTGVDTKYNRKLVLLFPSWLIIKIKTYANSLRAQKRRNNSTLRDRSNQYLFLTKRGAPYYMAKNDPNYRIIRNPPAGNTVQKFIEDTLKKTMRSHGNDFPFRFHDLRATFGMNLLEEGTTLINSGQASLLNVLCLVRDRMGHRSLKTTERYLEYRQKYNLLVNAQSEYERYLLNLFGHVPDE